MLKLKTIILLLFLSVQYSYSQVSKSELTEMMNGFMENYYSSCFSERKYVQYTARVSDYSFIDEQTIKVEGTHSYRGSFGSLYEDMSFYCYITINSSSSMTFELHKKSAQDFLHSKPYWEECTKTVRK